MKLSISALVVVTIAVCLALFSSTVTQTTFGLTNYNFIDSWGSFGISNPGHFSHPQFIAVSDEDGSVYVSDLGNKRIQKFSNTGQYVTQWGSSGTGDGEFHYPSGIAVSDDGVFVVDRDLSRVQKFTTDGEFVLQWGTRGSNSGQMSLPNGVAVNNGTVYVVDTGNQRIQTFTTDGQFVSSFGSSGQGDGQFLTAIGIDIATDDVGDSHVYVTDKGNGKIEKFHLNGTFAQSFSFHSPNYTFTPEAIAVGPTGKMFVSNSDNDRILHLSPSTLRLSHTAQTGPYPNSFNIVTDIAIGTNGELLVVDSAHHNIKLFETPFYIEPVIADVAGNDVSDSQDSLVASNGIDTRPPLIVAPTSLAVEATDMQTVVSLGDALAADESGIKTIINNAPDSFGPGTTSVLWIAFDNAGNTANTYQTVTIKTCGYDKADYNIIVGTEGNDVLLGTQGNDLIFGLDGDDVILGNDGSDCIYGGIGDDVIIGGSGNDTIRGNAGDDIIRGQSGSDIIYSNSGSDIVDGGTDSDGCHTADSDNIQSLNCEA